MLDNRYSTALTLSYQVCYLLTIISLYITLAQIEATDTAMLRLNGSVDNLGTCEMTFMGNLANSDFEILLPRVRPSSLPLLWLC